MIIDFHTHIYPERIAAKILPAAKRTLNVEVPGTGSPQDLRLHMSKSEISRSVILPLAKGKDDTPVLNDWIKSVSGDGLIPFGAIHPFMNDLEAELDRLAADGIRGVKVMPLLQEVYPDDPRCGRLYEALIDRKMILVTHAGRDPLDREEVFGTPKRFSQVMGSYPDLILVLAHLGGLGMYDDVRRYLMDAGKNVFFDTAYVSFYADCIEMTKLIQDIGPKKVIFGSDYPWEEPGRAARIIKHIELSEAEKEDVLWKNAANLIGLNHE